MRYTISFALATAMGLGGAAAQAAVPQVVTDIVPVQGLVAMVMGDLGQPQLLLEQGANAHHVQMRPSQAAALAGAGLVVWVGPEMTPWLDQAMTGAAADVAQLRLLAVPGTHVQDFGATAAHDHDAAADDHGHDHGAEDHADAEHADADHGAEGHDDHAHTGLDPHAWLDPANGALWLGAIAAELGRIDPEHAAVYAANAAAGAEAIARADAEIAARLAPLHDRPFVVFHDAYGYFAGHYGLNVAGSVALGDAAAPGAAHLAELRDTTAGGGALCLFPEAGHDPKLVAQLAEASGVRLGGALDPEGAAVAPGPGAYLAVLQGLAETLAGCLAAN